MLRFLLDLPGRLSGSPFWRPPAPLSHALSTEDLTTRVVQSPRGNGYLSLDFPLNIFEADGGLLTWASSGRTAFACGGVHGGGQHLLPQYREYLKEQGFRRALIFPVAHDEREQLHRGGFPSVRIGSEAFVDPDSFTLRGKAFVDLRQMVNRAEKRHGVTVKEVHVPEHATELSAVYDAWLKTRSVWRPMALVVGSPAFERPLGRRYFAAFVGGRMVAFVTLIPGWGGTGMGLDVMARYPDAPAGTMDVLLVRAIEWCFDAGMRVFSLGGCPMAEHGTLDADDPWVLRRIFRLLYRTRVGNYLFNFNSLVQFKAKFAPRWEPVYIAGWPRVSVRSLYTGCRMWGLFGKPALDRMVPRQLPSPVQ